MGESPVPPPAADLHPPDTDGSAELKAEAAEVILANADYVRRTALKHSANAVRQARYRGDLTADPDDLLAALYPFCAKAVFAWVRDGRPGTVRTYLWWGVKAWRGATRRSLQGRVDVFTAAALDAGHDGYTWEQPDPSTAEPTAGLEAAEVRRLVARLHPPSVRQAVEAVFLHDLTLSQTAKLIGKSRCDSARQRVVLGLELLRQMTQSSDTDAWKPAGRGRPRKRPDESTPVTPEAP